MESHNLSLRNLIQQDIKEQNKGMYRKLFLSRMLKAMDSDSVFDQIIKCLKKDMVHYFESMSL